VVIGAGSVGANAVRIAVGMGAEVTLFDRGTAKLERLDQAWRGRVRTRVSEPAALAAEIPEADLVIGAVLAPGKLAPKLIGRELLRRMRPGSVLVDVAIDQGGIAETSRPTTHSDPIYVEEGVIHYCVANMPAAYARTRNALDGAVSGLSPYITHGFVSLTDVLAGVAARHALDVQHKFVFELGWRAYFRHAQRGRGHQSSII
jgi:alanine dehydrogenase